MDIVTYQHFTAITMAARQRPFCSAPFFPQNWQFTSKYRILTETNVWGQILHCVLKAQSDMKFNEKVEQKAVVS